MSDLTHDRAAFKTLFADFLKKARPLLTEASKSEHFDFEDADGCLDEIIGFADAIDATFVTALVREEDAQTIPRHFGNNPSAFPWAAE